MAVSKEEFSRALQSLEEVLALPENDIVRDATIQRFEFTVELAWKVCKKLMGTATTAPKDVVREMAQNGYIDDPETWLSAIDHRNLSFHTYNRALADKVYAFARHFLPLAAVLRARIDSR